MTRCRSRPSWLRSEQTIDLDDEGAARKRRETLPERVAVLVEHDEELAAGTVFPSQPHVRAHVMRGGVVLQQRAREHLRGHRVGDTRADELIPERALIQLDDVEQVRGLKRQL